MKTLILLLFPVLALAQTATLTKNGLTRQGITTYGSGTMVVTGPLKTFVASTTINSSSEATVNLTSDNTTTGTALFSQILYAESVATVAATTATDVIYSSLKNIGTGNRTITFRYAKGQPSIVLAGASALAAPSGTIVTIQLTGL